MQTIPVIEKGIGEPSDNYLLIILSMGDSVSFPF
jgi:hypothetical protein